MNGDDWEDSAKELSSSLAASSSVAAAPSISVRPPTDSIYPVQAPYGDLQVQGLTPPRDVFGFDADSVLRDYQFPPALRDYQLPAQFNLSEPPTPPRTEAVPSPSRSLASGGSSPADVPASPDSDAVMGDNSAGSGFRNGIFGMSSGGPGRHGQPPLADDSSNDIDAEHNLLQFFDFAEAASSPNPNPSALTAQRQTPQQYQSQSQSQFGHMTHAHISGSTHRPMAGGKRPREEEVDTSNFDGGGASPMEVEREYNPEMPLGNGGFGIDFSSSPLVDAPLFPTAPTEPLQPAVRLPQNGIGSDFDYQLMVDFPECKKAPGPMSYEDPQVKSRVETQMSVRFIITPAPEGVAKLRLPRHAISKIKFIEDGHPANSPDTLELQATLVCASAMAVQDQLTRALYEARGDPVPGWITKLQHDKVEAQKRRKADAATDRSREDGGVSGSSSSSGSGEGTVAREDKEIDYNNPVFGAPVRICEQCMNRERKRMDRKKKKTPEEKEWAQDVKKRILVFNTNQIRQLEQYPGAHGAIAADTKMRICCYCRHHGEKDGFQVIFTLKNHRGNVLAQTISSTIVITDDHKNAAAANATMLPDGSDQMSPPQAPPRQMAGYPQPAFMVSQSRQGQERLRGYTPQPTNGLSFPVHMDQSPSPRASMRGSLGPRGHQRKRRRGIKVPTNLTMTPSEPVQFHRPQFGNGNMAFAHSRGEVPRQQWQNTGSLSPMAPAGEAFFDNTSSWMSPVETNGNGFGRTLGSPDFASIPTTTPTMFNMHQLPNPLISSQFARGLLELGQTRQGQAHVDEMQTNGPSISHVVPCEGTCRGGIEITILGRAFAQGLTVMFGDLPANDTTCLGDSTLLCRLPPNPNPGFVVVTLKNIERPHQAHNVPVFFQYVDDIEKDLLALALAVICIKTKGDISAGEQVALAILRDNGVGEMEIENIRNGGGNQRTMDVEALLLTCLGVIDMDESPHPTMLGHRNSSGQTMLHLACMLGMQKFVAALLARGVNVNSVDKNDYTPLHFAALHKRSDIVRRLLMNRADAGMRTRGGETAADLGESDQIVRATRSVHQICSRHHSRSSSISSEARFSRSRSGSVSSSNLASMSKAHLRSVDDYFADGDDDDEDHMDYDSSEDGEPGWASRRASIQDIPVPMQGHAAKEQSVEMMPPIDASFGKNATAPLMVAWMDAWRGQLMQSFQNLQLNIPVLPMTQIDYQAMLRDQMAKLQYPQMPKWGFAQDPDRKEADYKWSELLHPPTAPDSSGEMAPPAYDELYPDGNASGGAPPEKIKPAPNAPVQVEAESSKPTRVASPDLSMDLREIQRQITRRHQPLTSAQQAHLRKMKRIESDRRLYFFWIPVLVFIIMAMAYSHVPQAWVICKTVASFIHQAVNER